MQLEQWSQQKYFYSGSYAGYVEKIFLDSVSSTEARDDQAPALFIAGRFYAIYGQDVTDEILACFKPSF